MADTKELFQRYLPEWVVEWLDYYARVAADNPVEFILSGGYCTRSLCSFLC